MKKLLLATTALALSAGVASAQGVSLSGDARMGITYTSTPAPNMGKFRFDSRARVAFTLSGETDGGLAFGAWFRAHGAGDAASGNIGSNASYVFISGDFGRLEMGDTAGAVQSAVGDLHAVGYTGLGFQSDNTFIQRNFNGGVGNTGGTNVRYSYTMDGLSVFASVGQINTIGGMTNFAPALPLADLTARASMYGIGARYSFDGFTVGGGYEHFKAGTTSGGHMALAVSANFDDIEVRATAGRLTSDLASAAVSKNQMGVSVSGGFDATTVTAFVRRDFAKDTHYGIGASYDLGGGASLAGGIVRTRFNAPGNRTVADLGLNFSF